MMAWRIASVVLSLTSAIAISTKVVVSKATSTFSPGGKLSCQRAIAFFIVSPEGYQ
ncbi:hypothetical protein [Microcystis sp.]|uniref:hypothetical protein n=2 Tax=Microcystis sp. TaxID=1127 RepID=UPI00391D083C